MVDADVHTNRAALTARKPTECLLGCDPGLLSPVMVYQQTAKGFKLKAVQEMLLTSDLYSAKQILLRILGKSARTIQRQGSSKQTVRLNCQQSAVALQYAWVLEHAIRVFGTQKLAEGWLGQPCKCLDGEVPLDIVANPVGFQVVDDYLARIEYGVYQ